MKSSIEQWWLTRPKKQLGTEGALLAHQVLAQIYEAEGELELPEIHKELGDGKISFLE